MIEVREYRTANGRSFFDEWISSLDVETRRRMNRVRQRMAEGKLSNTKRLPGGIFEYRINFGPGYRIYFGREGDRIIILLGGGTKQRQSVDIRRAQGMWKDHLQRNP